MPIVMATAAITATVRCMPTVAAMGVALMPMLAAALGMTRLLVAMTAGLLVTVSLLMPIVMATAAITATVRCMPTVAAMGVALMPMLAAALGMTRLLVAMTAGLLVTVSL